MDKLFANRYFFTALALVPVITAAIGYLSLLNEPYLGLNYELKNGKWYISSVDRDSPASQYPELKGKELVYIDEWHVEKQDLTKTIFSINAKDSHDHFWAAQKYFSDHIEKGKPLYISVSDGGSLARYSITPAAMPLDRVIFHNLATLSLIIAAIMITVSYIVIRKKNDLPAILYFLLSTVGLGLYVVTLGTLFNRGLFFDFHISLTLYILAYISVVFALASTLHFSLIFPRKKALKYKEIIIPFMYIFMASLLFIQGFRISQAEIMFMRIMQLVYLLIAAILLIHTYITSTSSIEKAQTKWVIAGLSIMFTIIASVVAIHYFTEVLYYPVIIISALLLPVSMGFGIMKYKLMEVDTLFDTTLIYTATLGVLALIDMAVITFLMDLKVLHFNITEPVAIILSVWVIIFAYVPVRDGMKYLIKKGLKREIYDTEHIALHLSQSMLLASGTKAVFDKAVDTISDTLRPKNIVPVMLNEHGLIRIDNPAEKITYTDHGELSKYAVPVQVMNPDSTLDGQVVVPIIGQKGHIGCILLHDKHSGRLYDRNDLKLLSIIANQAAITIDAMQYREELHKQEEEAIKDKERISREIHDGIGSRLATSLLLSDKIKSNNGSYIDDLQRNLREGIREMRELLWIVEDNNNTLQDLVDYIHDKIVIFRNSDTIRFNIEIDIAELEIRVSYLAKLNLLRIVQEAITNVIKHSKAAECSVSIREKDKKFVLKIEDNGIGFDVENINSDNYGLRNIRKRCNELGAEFDITSQKSKGTKIMIALNLEEKKIK